MPSLITKIIEILCFHCLQNGSHSKEMKAYKPNGKSQHSEAAVGKVLPGGRLYRHSVTFSFNLDHCITKFKLTSSRSLKTDIERKVPHYRCEVPLTL